MLLWPVPEQMSSLSSLDCLLILQEELEKLLVPELADKITACHETTMVAPPLNDAYPAFRNGYTDGKTVFAQLDI